MKDVASQPEKDIAVVASEARPVEEFPLSAHPLNHVDPFTTKMTILRPIAWRRKAGTCRKKGNILLFINTVLLRQVFEVLLVPDLTGAAAFELPASFEARSSWWAWSRWRCWISPFCRRRHLLPFELVLQPGPIPYWNPSDQSPEPFPHEVSSEACPDLRPLPRICLEEKQTQVVVSTTAALLFQSFCNT